MKPQEKRELENWLMTHGLDGCLGDPEKLQVFADLVGAWPGDKHEFMRDLLNECAPENRYEMYQAIAPRLKFKAMSFSQYEAQIALKAGQMVSQRLMRVEGERPKAIEIGGHRVAITSQELADCGWAVVSCHVCEKTDKFIADTPVGAIIKARQAGWVRLPGIERETCAACAAGMATDAERLADGLGVVLVNDRRRVN